MKSLLLTLVLVLVPSLQQPVSKFRHAERIDEHYDKFKDQTGVLLWRMKLARGAAGDFPPGANMIAPVELSVVAVYPGKNLPEKFASNLLLSFTVDIKRHNPLARQSLIFLVDGQRTILETNTGTFPPERTGKVEFAVNVTYTFFQQLRDAKVVEGQLGVDEFHFDKENAEAIKDFDSRLHPH